MKLLSVISSCAEILGLQDIIEQTRKPNVTFEELKTNNNFNVLHRCANLVLGNIAANYVQCKTSQAFAVSSNSINLNELEHGLIKVINVKQDGRNVGYELFPDCLKLPNGNATVEYAYVPRFNGISNEVAIQGVSEECVTYGVLAEYAFTSGMFNEAKVWGEKFGQFLFAAARKDVTMPAAW